MNKLTKIEIWWQEPFTKKDIKKNFSDQENSYGLYQIYGTHNISGPNTLLYIGKAADQTFSRRLIQHDWTEFEASTTQFFIGQLGGIKTCLVLQTNGQYPIVLQHIDVWRTLFHYLSWWCVNKASSLATH